LFQSAAATLKLGWFVAEGDIFCIKRGLSKSTFWKSVRCEEMIWEVMVEMKRANLLILIAVRYSSHQGRFRRRLLGGDFSRSFRRHNSETFVGADGRRIAAHRSDRGTLLPD
jgi:hypothetical protein